MGHRQAGLGLPRQLRRDPRRPQRPLRGLRGGVRRPARFVPLRRRLAPLLLSERVRRQGLLLFRSCLDAHCIISLLRQAEL